jgi:hypothetical protein
MSSRACAATACVLGLLLGGCGGDAKTDTPGAAGSTSNEAVHSVTLTVGPDARTFVELAGPSRVELEGDGSDSIAWDLAIQGHDVFSNGGVSGPGNCSAFGPLSAPTFLSDSVEVPITLNDRAGGALLEWYDYGGATHQLFSRYHVYGIQDGERLFKLQVLGYYGEQLGAPVAALYRVRYAEVTADGVGKTQEVVDIDATAGGSKANEQEPSGCLDLDSGKVTPLTPKEAAASSDWQICFRREIISVNGGASGPRGMQAVDLQAADTSTETEHDIQARTADSELALFDGVDYDTLSDAALDYRADGVVTAFAERWLEPGSEPLQLSASTWWVIGADGASKYLLRFTKLVGDPAIEDAKLTLETKSVQ